MPPTTFGVFFSVKSVRPGSTRSGEKATLNPSPTVSEERPLQSRHQQLARRTWIGGRLQHDQLPFAHDAGQRLR